MRLDDAPLRVAVVYAVLGVLWITLTDWLLLQVGPDVARSAQVGKGLLFVLLSASLIFLLVRREFRKRAQLEEEREHLHRRLAASKRLEAIGQLTAGIAHDFNNLLTAINGNLASYIESSTRPEHEIVELTEAAAAAHRGEMLTRQLLAFGRQQDLRSEPLDLNEVILDLTQLLHRLIGDRIEVVNDLTEDLWVINMDRGPLQQLVMNLALNARDAMPEGGRLTLSTATTTLTEEYARDHFDFSVAPGDYVRLVVEDTGIGMDAETRARIYEPFFTTKAKHVGTGLGMSTVYGVVKQSGGYIDLESAPGKGTRFELFFPRGEGEPVRESSPRSETPAATPPRNGTGTVLVVEDEPSVRSFVVRSLQRYGFTTLECATGAEAVELLRSPGAPAVDLLLTDAVMPGMTGPELIDQVHRIHIELRTLLMSGYTRGEVAPGSPYLAKPFTSEELVNRVRQVLGS